MKLKYLLLCVGLLASAPAFSQIQYIPAAVHRFSIGLGGGITTLYGDLQKPKVICPAGKLNLDYNFTPFISAGIEGQYGKFAGGDAAPNGETFGLYSESNFIAVNANARLAVGQFLPVPDTKFQEILGGIYLGAGIGYINSEIQELSRAYSYAGNTQLVGTFHNEAEEIVIPLNAGLNFDLPVYRMGININYQYNLSTTEALDGYDVSILSNNDNDAYSFISVSVKYFFGGTH